MNYLFAGTVEQAVDILTGNGGRARIIAGGTDLMQALRDRKIDAQTLVDITRIEGLGQIDLDGEWIRIGAAVTFAMLRDSPLIREHARCLACAAASVGAAPIQAMATWAGNIVQAMPAADGGVAAVALDAQARVVDAEGPAGSPSKRCTRVPRPPRWTRRDRWYPTFDSPCRSRAPEAPGDASEGDRRSRCRF